MKGKYKIGKRDSSQWGIKIKYWLHGLEKSNETAVDRVVVLHSWEAVSNEEVYPEVSPLSWGCPAVSNDFMKKLDEKLKIAKKPVLLWIVD
jgi:predicted aconitase